MPITLIRTPATAGPTTRAPLKIIELSAIALGKSSRPTISTTKVWRAGMSKAVTRPLIAARMITYSTRTTPAQVSAARMNAFNISSTCVVTINRRRSAWSTITPANSVTSSTGK
jgi:hypothetical protein